jgi:hypothetical protein
MLEPDARSLQEADQLDSWKGEFEELRKRVRSAALDAQLSPTSDAFDTVDDALGDIIGSLESNAQSLRDNAMETAAEARAEWRRG